MTKDSKILHQIGIGNPGKEHICFRYAKKNRIYNWGYQQCEFSSYEGSPPALPMFHETCPV